MAIARLKLIIGMTVGWLMFAVLTGCGGVAETTPTHQRVVLGGRVFNLELALDGQARYQGLSDRREVSVEGGMLFVFPRAGVLQFVMRRCLVPIDLIFLGPNGRVVGTHAMVVEPFDRPEDELRRYTSRWPAQFAIELRGGTLGSFGLKPGTKVDLPLEALKKQAR